MSPLAFIATIRRAMRRHQGVPDPKARVPMWRLLAGEVAWGIRQLIPHPLVLAGLAGGFVTTIAVLSAAAPGPILDLQWRVLVAVAVGLLLAAGARRLEESTGAPSDASDADRPLLGATVVSAAIIVLVLVAWLVVWTIEVTT